MGVESYEALLEKREAAREEMRKYHKETAVLWGIARALGHWIEVKDDRSFWDRPAEDYICSWVINGVRKSDAKEDDIREILRILKLPENHIITIKGYGYTR